MLKQFGEILATLAVVHLVAVALWDISVILAGQPDATLTNLTRGNWRGVVIGALLGLFIFAHFFSMSDRAPKGN